MEGQCFSNDLIWVSSGLFATLGTFVVGMILSYAVRPFFLSRYLYVASAVVYVCFGICISKLKFRRLCALLLIWAILYSKLPVLKAVMAGEKNLNSDNEVFLENVVVPADDIIYVNSTELRWGLLEWYYPEIRYSYNPDLFIDDLNMIEEEKEFFMIWNVELSEDELLIAAEGNFGVEKIFEGRLGNDKYYYVYKVLHK